MGQSINRFSKEYWALGVEEFEESDEEAVSDSDRITYTYTLWTNTSILVYNVILGKIECRVISKIYAFCKAVLAVEKPCENRRIKCTKVTKIITYTKQVP